MVNDKGCILCGGACPSAYFLSKDGVSFPLYIKVMVNEQSYNVGGQKSYSYVQKTILVHRETILGL